MTFERRQRFIVESESNRLYRKRVPGNEGQSVGDSDVSNVVSGIHCTPNKRCCIASVPREVLEPTSDPNGIVDAFPDIRCYKYPLGYFYCVYIAGSIHEMNPIMQGAVLEALKNGEIQNS